MSAFVEICQRLSLREPLRESLQIIVDLVESGDLPLAKAVDLQAVLHAVALKVRSVKSFDREFPSLCFALATGVGKTRLMAAIIAWLYATGRSKHFLVLAPGTTIYEKLKRDFDPASPKYLFKGLQQLFREPPVIVTGDDWERGHGVRIDDLKPMTLSASLFPTDQSPTINIFNIGKLNSRSKDQVRMRKDNEFVGSSYFDYLKSLPDLVMLMDEAHRYRADAGARSIDELQPVLGIELTATPRTTGAKSVEFNNIAYRFNLGAAIQKGFVKEPRVATRKDFNAKGVPAEALEMIKLEDGIHVHEYTKLQLLQYAQTRAVREVHPFMLVVASNTAHANELRQKIESDDFFNGRYRGRVIEIHSKTAQSESDENAAKLLRIEQDRNVDIVIHVDKLKEGWDVTNLYTIVPLRASAAEILTEQTIGRGLRLPYGQRTGENAVDMLTIVAHDRFREIIDAANRPDSLIRKLIEVGEGAEIDPQVMQPLLSLPAHQAEMQIDSSVQPVIFASPEDPLVSNTLSAATQQASNQSVLIDAVLNELERESRFVQRIKELSETERVRQIAARLSLQLPLLVDSPEALQHDVKTIINSIQKHSIEIPEISIVPSRHRNYSFAGFKLQQIDRIQLQPVSADILVHSLKDGGREYLTPMGKLKPLIDAETYLVDQLIQRDEIDYDSNAEVLFDLAAQVVRHLRSYLSSEEQVVNVAMHHRKTIADLIWLEMREHKVDDEVQYQPRVVKGFTVLRAQTLNSGDGQMHNFREEPPKGVRINRLVFTGFEKCCFVAQKFDSFEGEFQLARLLERDPQILKWLKPAHGQFKIFYDGGREYHPDFVVETDSDRLIIELKREDWKEDEVVKRKAQAASAWCKHASDLLIEKPFSYLLIPHLAFGPQTTFEYLRKTFPV